MQLAVHPYHKNSYPRRGILVRGAHVADWLLQVQAMELSLEELTAYPVPGTTANSIWGCLLVLHEERNVRIGKNDYCQCVRERLYLPENSRLYPELSAAELDRLLKDRPHLFHPETGWVELPEPVGWAKLLQLPAESERQIITPEATVFIPSRAHNFYRQSLPFEEVLEGLDIELLPGRKSNTRPLSFWEKVKLRLLRLLFGKPLPPGAAGKNHWWTRLLSRLRLKLRSKWMDKMQASLDELEERNNREVDKLLELFRKNPMEALKYAIPIDSEGVSRGSGPGSYVLTQLWGNLSASMSNWFGGGSGGSVSGSSGSVRLGKNYVDRLNQEYRNTAQNLMKNKEYQQAAFVYLRLLKDYYSGADALEKAGLYSEAASVYLKYANNKLRAAECYERGGLPLEAIGLYKELQRDEKVGDLYLSIGKKKEARLHYEKVIGQYADNHQYIKAAMIYRDKLDELEPAQALLLQGWQKDRDAVNCLNYYLATQAGPQPLEREIKRLYAQETDERNRDKYLQVLKYQVDRYEEIQDTLRDIAYEIVAGRIGTDPFIASELQAFNKKDKRLLKDILLYRQQQR
ncbi:MAG: hypothetical protein JST68_29020 [Bacteroidetes bacterium]|nr:hypothetical protein [Bacteroidota bacterium]